ncbi:MAG TPA: SgcJ/EcaC family oxidoreductase [Ktedonobacteraceae bacterium]
MNSSTLQPQDSLSPGESEVRALYQQLLDSWNKRNADIFASLFAEDGYSIGFDGSQLIGQGEIASTLHQIFADHPTAPYVSKVREVRLLSPDVAILRAVVGMVPTGQTNIVPALNAIQTLVAQKYDGNWRIVHFQNTPAQFHGRPELVEQMTEELQQLIQ